MKFKFLNVYTKMAFAALIAMAAISCEDDEPVTAGDGDPLNENVITVNATLSTTQPQIGEENLLPVSVTLDRSFATDAEVTVRATLTNGNVSTGIVTVAAGATSATGGITLPSDDGFVPAGFFDPAAGTLTASAILLDELEEGNAYIVTSNEVALDIWSMTAPGRGGLNYVLDWENAASVDLDLQVIDEAFTAILESSGSSDRFESDLFDTPGRADGVYVFYIRNFSDETTEDLEYRLFLTQPNGSLVVLSGVFEAGLPSGGARVPFAQFEKTTDPTTGAVSYVNIMNI